MNSLKAAQIDKRIDALVGPGKEVCIQKLQFNSFANGILLPLF